MKFDIALLTAGLLSTAVTAHPGGHHVPRAELMRRMEASQRCSNAAASLNRKRYNKRMMEKRENWNGHNVTYEITTDAPYYETIQNDTCVLTPEVTAGPYVWPRSQTLRQDMSEDQAGIPIWLDIGVLDINTCEPLPNALVSLWHCNATGSYSSFTGRDPNTPFAQLVESLNMTIGPGLDLHTDATTWLRGMWPTSEEGTLEMKTIFPGFYVERAIHIHAQVYTNWTLYENGTVSSGTVVNTGQLYFDEALEQQLMALEPYASHTEINRTTNDVDSVFSGDTKNGYNPVVSVVPVDGENVENGMIGYITIGVDPTSASSNTGFGR